MRSLSEPTWHTSVILRGFPNAARIADCRSLEAVLRHEVCGLDRRCLTTVSLFATASENLKRGSQEVAGPLQNQRSRTFGNVTSTGFVKPHPGKECSN